MRLAPLRKLRIALLLPLLGAVLAAGPLLWLLLSQQARGAVGEQLERALPVFGAVVAGRLGEPPAVLHEWLHEVAEGTELRITVLDLQGRVLADSARTLEQVSRMADQKTRPEVEGALRDGLGFAVRRSTTLDEAAVYAARRVRGGDGRHYVLRLGQTLGGLEALHGRLARALFLAALAAAAAAALVWWWLNREIFEPLAEVTRGAERLAWGEYGHRIRVPDVGELETLGHSLNRLGSRVEEQIAAAEAERSHLEVIGASMQEGVLVTDAEGRALMVNPSFRRLFRVRGEVVGKTLLELTRQGRLDDLVARTLATGESRAVELELAAPGRKAVAVSASALRDRSGVVVAARDISDLLLLGEIRRDLVANVSHELKTPLSAIRGYAETLQDGALEDPEAAGRFVGRILQQCGRLQALLDDLLTLSRLEKQGEPVEMQRVELGGLVTQTLEDFEAAAREKRVRLEADLGDLGPVEGDPAALEDLCRNLIDNAIKYNREGGTVRVRARQGVSRVALEVADTGRGIPEEALSRIFERFYRVDRGRSRKEGGTGLGLAIVKHAVRKHGGEIEVDSRVGEGSTFRVSLPRRQVRPDPRLQL